MQSHLQTVVGVEVWVDLGNISILKGTESARDKTILTNLFTDFVTSYGSEFFIHLHDNLFRKFLKKFRVQHLFTYFLTTVFQKKYSQFWFTTFFSTFDHQLFLCVVFSFCLFLYLALLVTKIKQFSCTQHIPTKPKPAHQFVFVTVKVMFVAAGFVFADFKAICAGPSALLLETFLFVP